MKPMLHYWVQIYTKKKDINYISLSIVRGSVEIRPPQLHNLPYFLEQ